MPTSYFRVAREKSWKKNYEKVREIHEKLSKAPVPLGRIFFPIVHDRDEFSNRKQSETNLIDEKAMCDYLSEYLRMCFRLYGDS